MNIKILESTDKSSLNEFVSLPHRLYKDSPKWVAPLRSEVLHKLDTKKNPFYEYGQLSITAAYDDQNRRIGRLVAIINPLHYEQHGEAGGFFGLFESIDNLEVAKNMFEAVGDYLSNEGCTSVIGPVNLSTNDESGFLIDGFDSFPSFMCNYCHPYYNDLISDCGFEKKIDTYSYECQTHHLLPEKYQRVIDRAEGNSDIATRHFTKKTAVRDIEEITSIYNNSFRNTWGFVPISSGEAVELANSLLPFVDERLIWITTYRGKPVGSLLAFPDINEVLRHLNGKLSPINIIKFIIGKKKIKGMRVAALGVLPEYRNLGIEALLIRKIQERVIERPYARAEFSVVMENNHRMRNLLISAGFKQCRQYRIYGRDL